MTSAHYVADRRTVRVGGTIAAFALLASVLSVQPWLADQGLELASWTVNAALALVVLYSAFEDVRHWRESDTEEHS